jgi:hypothetical protein
MEPDPFPSTGQFMSRQESTCSTVADKVRDFYNSHPYPPPVAELASDPSPKLFIIREKNNRMVGAHFSKNSGGTTRSVLMHHKRDL